MAESDSQLSIFNQRKEREGMLRRAKGSGRNRPYSWKKKNDSVGDNRKSFLSRNINHCLPSSASSARLVASHCAVGLNILRTCRRIRASCWAYRAARTSWEQDHPGLGAGPAFPPGPDDLRATHSISLHLYLLQRKMNAFHQMALKSLE